ncbi:ArgE/DapE family deacylase [Neobacillus mesonae]|uniref:Acetylornithine deacetylase n=1 Tax=Neobacillus mesonae TaxID=1193713 RepID=A0A3T0HZI4_9BACI|nr:ArgE/DapE family deacylase [Neobacillus mesonae]AZU62546.1 acetylornithine deacetylase [Neobacillus mesonae]
MDALEKVFEQIDQSWDDEVKFLQQLGRFPSTLGNETATQRFLANKFREMSLETDEFIPDVKKLSSLPGFSAPEWSYDGRPIVVGKLPTKGPKQGKSLILQGHIDVVSPEPMRLWDYDPWGSTIEGDRMYGRGLCDMKSGVAAMIYAVKAIQDAGIELGADVLLETVYEEECTGNGALATLQRGYVADGGLIPEPFGPTALKAQVGVIWMRVRVTGAGSHVNIANQSVNAIEKSYILIDALKKYREYINYTKPKHEAFKDVDHPLNVNIGIIKSGDWASTVPADCMFEVRIGLYPDQDPQEIKDEVKAWLLEAAAQDPWLKEVQPEITFYGFHAHGVNLEENLEVYSYLDAAHHKVYDSEMKYLATTATTDVRFYNLFYNIPMTCYGPTGGDMHGANEWVDLTSVREVTKVYAAFILDWCGIRK